MEIILTINNEFDEKNELLVAKSGDSQAIQRLFVRYEGLFCYAWQHYHPNELSLHDWLANMYQVLYEAIMHYDFNQASSFSHYLYRALENCAKERFRRSSAKKRVPQSCLVNLEDQVGLANFESVEESVYCYLTFNQYLKEDLSPFEHDVLVASLSLDMPGLCQKFNCQPRVIQSALSRCRKKLILALHA